PLAQTDGTFTPSSATDLFMGSGDRLSIDISDSTAGLRTVVHDLSTGQTGSMTASAANGFAQVMYEPTSPTCHTTLYSFRPMYATSSEHTRVPWAAHTYNVAFSDEIGHFEFCNAADENGDCTEPGVQEHGVLDDDDAFCFNADDSLLVQVGGCVATDTDFDGSSYKRAWPGTGPRSQDARLHPTPITFSSPLFNGTQNYSRVAFETDLPRIEASDFGGSCNRQTGEGCTNPPPGAEFYPIYTTANATLDPSRAGSCVWHFGGADLAGTTNSFGGNSTAEYGPLLFSFYPGPDPGKRRRTNNFHNTLSSNPC